GGSEVGSGDQAGTRADRRCSRPAGGTPPGSAKPAISGPQRGSIKESVRVQANGSFEAPPPRRHHLREELHQRQRVWRGHLPPFTREWWLLAVSVLASLPDPVSLSPATSLRKTAKKRDQKTM